MSSTPIHKVKQREKTESECIVPGIPKVVLVTSRHGHTCYVSRFEYHVDPSESERIRNAVGGLSDILKDVSRSENSEVLLSNCGAYLGLRAEPCSTKFPSLAYVTHGRFSIKVDNRGFVEVSAGMLRANEVEKATEIIDQTVSIFRKKNGLAAEIGK